MSLPGPEQRAGLLVQARELCDRHKATLLFLTLFGSSLYGTRVPGKSDLDVRGIFLPSGTATDPGATPGHLHASTGDGMRRNTPDDVDLDLWSLQRWLLRDLPAGDMGALDLLFAPSHRACVLWQAPCLEPVFREPLRFLDTTSGRAWADYSLGQAKKYGIRGSRMGALRCVLHWLETHPVADGGAGAGNGDRDSGRDGGARLGPHMEPIIACCGDSRFCFPLETRQGPGLHVCGKTHMGSLRMDAFARRIREQMEREGARVLEAERNEGIDFKALSHAVRALDQMEELLVEGRIVFPLKTRNRLIAIREGQLPWSDLEPLILRRLEEVEALRLRSVFTGPSDPPYARRCVLECQASVQGERGPFA